MSLVIAGSEHTFKASFRDSSGNLADPDSVIIDIEDPDGAPVVDNNTPTTHPTAGKYTYVYQVPTPAIEGTWKIIWTAVRDGVPAVGYEEFEVLNSASVITDPVNIVNLRLLLWEKVPDGGTEADTLFTDDELATILALANGVMDRAAAIGWSIKGGHYADAIDINESGSNRRLNQLFTNCERMWKRYDTQAAAIELAAGMAVGRVPGVGFATLGNSRDADLPIFFDLDQINVRAFPLKRFMAILQ